MDIAIILLLLAAALFFSFRMHSISKKKGYSVIEKEIEADFKVEFDQSADGEISPQGMRSLVEWCEDDIRESKMAKAKQIERFDVL
jgi:hypothetical protein